jgi:cytochrome c
MKVFFNSAAIGNLTVILAALAVAGSAFAAAPVDEEAAKVTARGSGCFKCHSVQKKGDGPAYKDVAAKYRGKPNAEARLVEHITTGEKAKFEDGHEEEHKIVKTKDMNEIKNLVNWILSQ